MRKTEMNRRIQEKARKSITSLVKNAQDVVDCFEHLSDTEVDLDLAGDWREFHRVATTLYNVASQLDVDMDRHDLKMKRR